MSKIDKDQLIDIFRAIHDEQNRSRRILHMTANENIMSKTATSFLSSNLSYRYYAGNYYESFRERSNCCIIKGLMMHTFPSVNYLESLARDSMNEMFNVNYCDFKPLSGIHGVFCILSTMSKPGDNVYVLSPGSIEHHATVSLLERLGRKASLIPWSFEKYDINLEQFEKDIKKTNLI